MNILFTKYGSVFRTRDSIGRASPVGEQGETEGILRYLLQHPKIKRVIYFGQYNGTPFPGLTIIKSNIEGHTDLTTHAQQMEGFNKDIEALTPYAPFAGFIMTTGYAVTMSMIRNPNGTAPWAVCIRYVAPILNVLEHFKLRRICINNDPRGYPKDQEMSFHWPHTRPVAMLDQWDDERKITVGGKRYRRKCVYAGVEKWGYLSPLIEYVRDIPCTAIAHAHIDDGCKGGEPRNNAWANILAPQEDVDELFDMGMRVYGRGWDSYSDYDSELMPGCIPPDQVVEKLSQSTCGPIVAVTPKFRTGKIILYAAHGCLPLLYGDGTNPYTYDPYAEYLPLDSPMRIVKPGDLLRLVKWCQDNKLRVKQLLAELSQRIRPDWSMFDSLLDDLYCDRPLDERYGGYFNA